MRSTCDVMCRQTAAQDQTNRSPLRYRPCQRPLQRWSTLSQSRPWICSR